jgi:hypothetical protein
MINLLTKLNYHPITPKQVAMNNLAASYGEFAHKRTSSSFFAGSAQQSRARQTNVKNKRSPHPARNCRGYIFHGRNYYNFIDGFIFISSFQDEKDFSGIPKIELRKSETKTYRKICGLRMD